MFRPTSVRSQEYRLHTQWGMITVCVCLLTVNNNTIKVTNNEV